MDCLIIISSFGGARAILFVFFLLQVESKANLLNSSGSYFVIQKSVTVLNIVAKMFEKG